jgi:hypothetical protein
MSRTRKFMLSVALLTFGVVRGAEAQVSVFTPALYSNTSATQIICRATNTDTLGQFITVQFRNAFSGQAGITTVFPLSSGQTAELAGGAGDSYCEAIANTGTIADKVLLSVSVRDGNDNATGALPGLRVISGSGAVQRTPSLEAVNAQLTCHVVNVGSSQTVTTKLVDDAGATLATRTDTLAAFTGIQLSAAAPVAGRCEVTAGSNTLAKDLRVSMFEDPGGPTDSSRAPLSGALR